MMAIDPFFMVRHPLLRFYSQSISTKHRTLLSEHTADPSLGQFQLGSDMVDAGSAARGAQKFPFVASARRAVLDAFAAPPSFCAVRATPRCVSGRRSPNFPP
jgi:hypothetical protein